MSTHVLKDTHYGALKCGSVYIYACGTLKINGFVPESPKPSCDKCKEVAQSEDSVLSEQLGSIFGVGGLNGLGS